MGLIARIRPDLAAFSPYASARRGGLEAPVRLDANESPWPAADDGFDLNRYPAPQPSALRAALADLYGVAGDQVWAGRGSDEAIDLLVRAFCRAGRDNIVSLAPTFGMYQIAARLQGAEYRMLNLSGDDGFALDPERLLALVDDNTRLVVVCSPNNPTGTSYHPWLEALATRLADQALVLVDEAYIEFAGHESASVLLDRHENIAVLRTLSKAHALAGARVGALLAAPWLVQLVGNIAAPYPLPTPSVAAALAALAPDKKEPVRERVAAIKRERERVRAQLERLPDVLRVWPSQGNFLLVRCREAETTFRRLLDGGVLVRDFSTRPGLEGCLRVTIGSGADNDRLVDVWAGAMAA